MIVLIVCLVLVAAGLVALAVLVFELLGHVRRLHREVVRAQQTLVRAEAELAALRATQDGANRADRVETTPRA